jgi:hypothetical protein
MASLNEPLRPDTARRLIRTILSSGTVRFSGHALSEMKKDGLTTVDCVNVLRGGVVEPAEFENGSWRYRVRTAKIYVVVAFRSEKAVVVITVWRVT